MSTTNTNETRFSVAAADSHAIEAYAWATPAAFAAPRAVVQLVHGMSEHIRRYRHVAQALTEQGYVVYGSEHRGHGQSAFDAGTAGDFGPHGFAALVDDMAAVTRALRERHPGLPVVMVAHSMGSMAAQVYLIEHSALVDAVALSGTTALEMLDVRTSGWTPETANASVGTPVTPADWLSRDPSVPAAFIADPLCGTPLTLESLFSIFDVGNRTADTALYTAVRKALPLYLFTGDRDPVNACLAWFDPLVYRLRGAGFRDVSTHVYGGARHEVLNETNREEVIANLIAWIRRAVG
jgi:alpha-beta hydrolase superfamily lysophospholipase